ncbi:MAG: hypothetical protein VW339_09295 [Quisquiliibacterium sp.]
MRTRKSWDTRDELLAQVVALESQAGLGACWSRARWAPAKGEGYEEWRKNLRQSYFGVGDADLRGALIGVASELYRRERLEAGVARDAERLHFQRVGSPSQSIPALRAFAIGSSMILVCGFFSGTAALLAAALPAIVLALGCLRDGRREVQVAAARSRGAVSFAERRFSQFANRQAPFSESEVETAMAMTEDQSIASRSAGPINERSQTAIRRALPSWVRPVLGTGASAVAA